MVNYCSELIQKFSELIQKFSVYNSSVSNSEWIMFLLEAIAGGYLSGRENSMYIIFSQQKRHTAKK